MKLHYSYWNSGSCYADKCLQIITEEDIQSGNAIRKSAGATWHTLILPHKYKSEFHKDVEVILQQAKAYAQVNINFQIIYV